MASESVLRVLIFMSVVMSSFCYVYIIPGEMGKSKDHEGFCFYNDTQKLIKRGQSVIIQETCEEISCGDDYTITVAGCGTFSLQDPNCLKWERDYTKPYPQCCTSFICIEYASNHVDDASIGRNTLD